MPSLLCPAFLVLLCACSQLFLARSETARSCLEEHAFPIASARNCTVVNSSLSLLSNSNEVHLTWRDHACRRKVIGASVCPGYAGMELTFQCDLEGTYLYSVIENKAMGPKAYFSMLLPKHDGEYQCRRYSNNETVSVYNITVIAGLGLPENYCGVERNYSSTYNCCKINRVIPKVEKNDPLLSSKFYAFGMSNVSLRHYWITAPLYHLPTDVGLTLSKPVNISSVDFQISVQNIPKRIEGIPKILAVISLADEFITRSVCIVVNFEVLPQDYSANNSLPLNVSVAQGDSATFECELGSFNPEDFSSLFNFHYNLSSQNTSVWNRSCSVGSLLAGECWVSGERDVGRYIPSLKVLQNEDGLAAFRFTFLVLNVDLKHNNSAFSCSILSGGQLQWLHSAYLNVTMATGALPGLGTLEVAVGVVILVVITAALALTGGVMLLRKKWRRRRRRRVLRESGTDQVPLTSPNGTHPNLCDSEANTPVDADSKNGMRTPAIQILRYGDGGVNGALVGQSMILPPDGDQGYQSCSQSDEDLSIGWQLKAMVNCTNEHRTPPNTLRLPGSIHSNSDLDLSSSHTAGNSTSLSQLCEHRSADSNHSIICQHSGCNTADVKCVVYVSYTDRMGPWVREYLKPLIESWKHSEVMLHEDDMIPGFTIPGERQRLILEAHKVVLVVSRDYSESPWCLYELQHAIQQEPALCRGRVIPILVDGCYTVPAIVRGVVPLMENDRHFSERLKKNIMGPNQLVT